MSTYKYTYWYDLTDKKKVLAKIMPDVKHKMVKTNTSKYAPYDHVIIRWFGATFEGIVLQCDEVIVPEKSVVEIIDMNHLIGDCDFSSRIYYNVDDEYVPEIEESSDEDSDKDDEPSEDESEDTDDSDEEDCKDSDDEDCKDSDEKSVDECDKKNKKNKKSKKCNACKLYTDKEMHNICPGLNNDTYGRFTAVSVKNIANAYAICGHYIPYELRFSNEDYDYDNYAIDSFSSVNITDKHNEEVCHYIIHKDAPEELCRLLDENDYNNFFNCLQWGIQMH